jgi:predicted metal-dependent hydrolase
MSSTLAQLPLFGSRDATDRWAVRVSRRARRLSVRVYPGGRVEVVVPRGASAATVQRFVGTHRQWIFRKIEDLATGSDPSTDRRPRIVDLPAIGRQFTVDYAPDARGAARAIESDDHTIVLAGVDDERHIGRVLRGWLTRHAEHALGEQLARVAEEGGFSYRRLQVRRQRTRWGSCSASGTISLNMCVMFLEPAIVRYLLVHELAHTRHMNHSRRFWSQVESLAPDYRALDRELLRGWQRVPGWIFS